MKFHTIKELERMIAPLLIASVEQRNKWIVVTTDYASFYEDPITKHKSLRSAPRFKIRSF